MRTESGGDSSADAATRRSMARRAVLWRACFASRVLLVVKVGCEAAQTAWKLFERGVLLTQTFLRVADSAQRRAGRIELRLVATDTSLVSRKFWLGGIIIA